LRFEESGLIFPFKSRNSGVPTSSLTILSGRIGAGLLKALLLSTGLVIAGVPAKLAAQEEEKPSAVAEAAKKAAATRTEEVALKEFKADMAGVKKWVQGEQAKISAHPMAMVKMLGEIDTKFVGVRTDGLPEDLASQYVKMSDAMKRISAIFKESPADEKDLAKWMVTKTKDPAFNETMQSLQKEAKVAGQALKEIGLKYGVTELDFDAKDKNSANGGGGEGKGKAGVKKSAEAPAKTKK